MVRVSDDAQAKFAVTSLVEPSLKVAMAFNWVVLPMATAACVGTMATEVNSAVAADASVAVMLVSIRAELTLAAGWLPATTAAVKPALTTALGT